MAVLLPLVRQHLQVNISVPEQCVSPNAPGIMQALCLFMEMRKIEPPGRQGLPCGTAHAFDLCGFFLRVVVAAMLQNWGSGPCHPRRLPALRQSKAAEQHQLATMCCVQLPSLDIVQCTLETATCAQ
jgi:hypothetical protein